MAQWCFLEKHKADINRDPIEGMFFTTEALDSVVDALVRESVQNSLDAGIPGNIVKIRFSFSNENSALPAKKNYQYFSSLWPHLKSPQSGLREIPEQNEPVSYLTVEDFGTRGLEGDVEQYEDTPTAEKNDFYYFWRNVGRSVKQHEDRGRWGLGKTVWQASSRINAFFGYTIRNEDNARFLMGQSVLMIHKVDSVSYIPYGYFGSFNNKFPMPLSDESILDEFRTDFNLNRKDEPGLSIVIPFPDPDINLKALINSVARHYFYPLLAGHLVVESAYGKKQYVLDADKLSDYVKKQEAGNKSGLVPLLALARWGIDLPPESYVRLNSSPANKKLTWTESRFGESLLKKLRLKFDNFERIALEVPLSIQAQDWTKPKATAFHLLIERDAELLKPQDRFIRQGITVSDVSTLRTKGVRAIVSITDPVLATFLGDSENPAHTQWERNNRHFKGKYKLAVSTLDFIKSSTRNIAYILSKPAVKVEQNLLKDVFSVSVNDLSLTKKELIPDDAGEKENIGAAPEDIQVDPKWRSLHLSRLDGGFRVYGAKKATSYPKEIDVLIAYEVRRGNPFNKYLPLDFEVNKPPLRLKINKAEIITHAENKIRIAITAPDFSLSVTGFDKNRDLRVKIIAAGDEN